MSVPVCRLCGLVCVLNIFVLPRYERNLRGSFRTGEDDGYGVHRYFRDFCYDESDLLIGFILHRAILVTSVVRYARKVKSGFIVSTTSR